uniref:Transposase n=1 Tax=Ditylenchus dipsaci TaxID=166011 RepID=A0A915D693_9BILA
MGAHNLSAANKAKRLQISRTLIARHEEDPFLDRIVTGDEKWILYANVQKSASGSVQAVKHVQRQKPVFIREK